MLKGTERPRQYRGSCQGGPSLRLPMSTRGGGSIQAPEEAQAHGHFVLGTMKECRRLKGQRSCGGKRRIPSAKESQGQRARGDRVARNAAVGKK